jgi:hypothetical protein
MGLGFALGLHACKAGALLLEPQSILLWLSWRWGLKNYLPGMASNCHPSVFQVARITGVSHKRLPTINCFNVTHSGQLESSKKHFNFIAFIL